MTLPICVKLSISSSCSCANGKMKKQVDEFFFQVGCYTDIGLHEDMQQVQFGGDVGPWNYPFFYHLPTYFSSTFYHYFSFIIPFFIHLLQLRIEQLLLPFDVLSG